MTWNNPTPLQKQSLAVWVHLTSLSLLISFSWHVFSFLEVSSPSHLISSHLSSSHLFSSQIISYPLISSCTLLSFFQLVSAHLTFSQLFSFQVFWFRLISRQLFSAGALGQRKNPIAAVTAKYQNRRGSVEWSSCPRPFSSKEFRYSMAKYLKQNRLIDRSHGHRTLF